MNLFKSFYGKLSLGFLLLLIALGVAQVSITFNSSMQYVREADQKLNLNLAKNMAAEFQPKIEDSLAIGKIKHSIHDMMVVNPRIEIYMLNGEGKILAYFIGPNKTIKTKTVDLTPVHEFLNKDYKNLILGQDPRNPGVQKPFSVAKIDIGLSQPGYIYIILGGQKYESALNALQDSYFIRTSMKVFGVILLITGIIGLILFAFLTKPLRRMTNSIEQFDRHHLDQRVPVTSNDEIGRLGQSFNRMAETIQENVKELEKTDRLRRELIANVSHDLRSPLASIQGYLETIMLKEDSLDKEKRKKYFGIILKNTNMLRTLVKELFELSKLDTQQVEPELELFSITDLAQDVTLKFEQQAGEKNINLKVKAPPNFPLAEGDIAMIERVLTNLIDNALEYTPADGNVSIRFEHHQNHVNILVCDSGTGVDEKDLPHIFDRFYRAEKSRSKHKSGTGLGLAIAKKIIELHDQEIGAKNRDAGGTEFYFTLSIQK